MLGASASNVNPCRVARRSRRRVYSRRQSAHQRLLVGNGAAAEVGSALVNLGHGASAEVGSTLVDLGDDAAAEVGSALVDLGATLEDAAAEVGSALVDLLVENKFHVGELHVDGWWV